MLAALTRFRFVFTLVLARCCFGGSVLAVRSCCCSCCVFFCALLPSFFLFSLALVFFFFVFLLRSLSAACVHACMPVSGATCTLCFQPLCVGTRCVRFMCVCVCPESSVLTIFFFCSHASRFLFVVGLAELSASGWKRRDELCIFAGGRDCL